MKRRAKRPSGNKTAARELPLEELKAIIARSQQRPLADEDREKLDGAIDTLAVLTVELEKKGASIRRLRQMLFGARTEKTSTLFDEDSPAEESGAADKDASADGLIGIVWK